VLAISLIVVVAPSIAVAAVYADARAGRPNMCASTDAVLANAGTRADGTNMRTGTHSAATDVRPNTDPENINVRADTVRICCTCAQQSQSENRNDQCFHGGSCRRVTCNGSSIVSFQVEALASSMSTQRFLQKSSQTATFFDS
jgi:hypothetical protein